METNQTVGRGRTLFKYVVPTILSTVSVFLYSIVDGILVGRGVGSDALGAVNLAFPFVMVYMALTMLTIIGGVTIAAIRIGRNDHEGANATFIHSFIATMIVSAIMMLVGLFFTEPVAKLMGAKGVYVDMVKEYLFWYAVFFIPCGCCNSLLGFCRNDGSPVMVSITTIIGTVFNIVGDYVMIFPLHMGLKGAAIATGVAQTLAMLICLTHFAKKKGILRFRREKWDFSLLKKILLRGAPECVNQFVTPMGLILTNNMLSLMLGNGEINAFSVIGYAASFAVSVFVGTAEGIQPLLGNRYGAKDEDSLKYYFHAGLIISFIGAVVLSALILYFWNPILTLFDVDEATRISAVFALPRYMSVFIFQSLIVIITSYLYSTTRTKQALTINVLRAFVLDTLAILLIPRLFGADSIWFTSPIYEFVALIVAVILLRRADKNGAIGKTAE